MSLHHRYARDELQPDTFLLSGCRLRSRSATDLLPEGWVRSRSATDPRPEGVELRPLPEGWEGLVYYPPSDVDTSPIGVCELGKYAYGSLTRCPTLVRPDPGVENARPAYKAFRAKLTFWNDFEAEVYAAFGGTEDFESGWEFQLSHAGGFNPPNVPTINNGRLALNLTTPRMEGSLFLARRYMHAASSTPPALWMLIVCSFASRLLFTFCL